MKVIYDSGRLTKRGSENLTTKKMKQNTNAFAIEKWWCSSSLFWKRAIFFRIKKSFKSIAFDKDESVGLHNEVISKWSVAAM